MIKYLKEASGIVYGDADKAAFLAGSECMTMPLKLEERSAEDILERRRCGVRRYHVASMPTLGVSTPVTLAGSIVMAAAELLGGMAVCWCADPESDLSARMITLVATCATATPPPSAGLRAVRQRGPPAVRARWGGHCMVEVFFSPTARRPGCRRCSRTTTAPAAGAAGRQPRHPLRRDGHPAQRGLGSPTQLMLDMEIRKAEWSYRSEVPVDAESLDWEEVLRVTEEGGNFLESEHTLRHCRELWLSELFRSDSPSRAWDGTEKAILDRCDQLWRERLRSTPSGLARGKAPGLDDLLARAAGRARERLTWPGAITGPWSWDTCSRPRRRPARRSPRAWASARAPWGRSAGACWTTGRCWGAREPAQRRGCA